MKSKYIILCFVFFAQYIYAQQDDKMPVPSIGWDSLKARIIYPDLFFRADIEGAFRVRINLDNSGNPNNIKVTYLNGISSEISKTDSILVKVIIKAFEGVKWSHSKLEFSIPVLFVIQSSKNYHRHQSEINSGEAIILKGSYRLNE
jgi:hypothetical protein